MHSFLFNSSSSPADKSLWTLHPLKAVNLGEPLLNHINFVFNLLPVCHLCPVPDKAEGNKFAKDFEDSSLKLQEFISFVDKELKTAPPLLEALGNADIFYEMQYKEVKIVANVSVGSNDIITFPALEGAIRKSKYNEDFFFFLERKSKWFSRQLLLKT